MGNKSNIYFILLAICMSVLVGCTDYMSDVVDDSLEGSVVITMEVHNYSSSSSKATAYSLQEGILGTAEYVISKLRVYVFNSNGTLDKQEVYDNLSANHVVQQIIEVPKDVTKQMYFVANEPDAMSSQLDAVTSAQGLKGINYTIAETMNKGFNAASEFSSSDFVMPMTATYDVLNATTDVKIYVGLDRAVARVDLNLAKSSEVASRAVELNSSTKFTVDGLTCTAPLFAGDIPEPKDVQSIEVASSEVSLTTTTYQRVLSFYVAERTYDYTDGDTKIQIQIDGMLEAGSEVSTKSVTLGDSQVLTNELTEIKRGYVYSINGYYNGEEIVADSFEVLDWEDVEIDAEIEGVMFAVDSEVAMDWLLNGNTYTSKTISFGSNKPLSFYLPVYVDNDDEFIPSYEFKLYEFEDMSAGESYNLKEIALEDNFIFATTWVESATIHFTSAQSGYIEFTYNQVKVSCKIQTYPIRIKSDNVIKQMKAVYDNGYIPASKLSDDWAGKAPGGVILAKRGEGNHPVRTPEILYRDDDGYYRGEYSTTAEDGTRYCQETFGDTWYMPSYSEMMELAVMYDELGVSYRFQNNGSEYNSGELTESPYWTSAASTAYPGYYWTADFMQRSYIADNLMSRRDGTESHFVRCVMDLQ